MGLLAMKVTLADGRELVVEADARIDTVDEHGAPVIRLMKDGRVVEAVIFHVYPAGSEWPIT